MRLLAEFGQALARLAARGCRHIVAAPLLLLAAGQILPFVLVAAGLATGWRGWPEWAIAAAWLGCGLAILPRLAEAMRFRQSLTSALAQPLAITVFLVIQWYALARKLLGLKTTWRGRPLAPQ